jgi:SAM-dependent methyltransferase
MVPEDSLDFIYTSNVLEHIEYDEDILRNLATKLKTGGTIAIYVPAFPILFSNLDRNVGHFRRYQKVELIKKLKGAGFEVIECNFSDSLGFISTLCLKLLGFKFDSGTQATVLMKIYDRLILPISKSVDFLGCKYLFGKNLIAYGKLKTELY